MKLNDVCLFVSTILHSEYITALSLTVKVFVIALFLKCCQIKFYRKLNKCLFN